MNGLTTTKGLIKRGVRAYRLAAAATALAAALILLPATPTQAQGGGEEAKHGFMIGLVPGQTLRVTIYNPVQFGLGDRSSEEGNVQPIVGAVAGHVKVLDSARNQIVLTDEVMIPAGEFRSFDIKRNHINLAGEPRTGRLQVRVKVVIVSSSTTAPEQDEEPGAGDFPYTFELMDHRSGATFSFGDGSVRFVRPSVAKPL